MSDNGSTDETAEVVAGWAGRLPRLRVVPAAEVRTVSHARNVGVGAADGRSSPLCDADDVVSPSWLREMVEAATLSTWSEAGSICRRSTRRRGRRASVDVPGRSRGHRRVPALRGRRQLRVQPGAVRRRRRLRPDLRWRRRRHRLLLAGSARRLSSGLPPRRSSRTGTDRVPAPDVDSSSGTGVRIHSSTARIASTGCRARPHSALSPEVPTSWRSPPCRSCPLRAHRTGCGRRR